MSERGPVAPGQTSPDVLKQRLTDHAASDRLVVARGVFAGPNVQVSDDMYARVVKGKARRERHALHLEQGATVDTNTYFGRLPASYFQRWTTRTGGAAAAGARTRRASARLALRGSDSHGNARTIASTEVDGTGTAVLSARLNEFVDGGVAVDGVHGRRRPGDDHEPRVDGAVASRRSARRRSRSARSTGPSTARPPSPRSPTTRACSTRSTPSTWWTRAPRPSPTSRCSTTSPPNSATSWCTCSRRISAAAAASPAGCTRFRASATTPT